MRRSKLRGEPEVSVVIPIVERFGDLRQLYKEFAAELERLGKSKYGISRIWKVFLDLLTVKMLLGFTTRPALWFGLLSLPFLVGMLLAFATSVYVHFVWTPHNDYPLVFPSATLLFAFAFAHLIVIGFFAELVVKVGDFKEAEAILAAVEPGGKES